MLRVTRYDENGKVFHTCLTPAPVTLDTDEHGRITVEMPLRYWRMVTGGRIEISLGN
jgi:hypothetical protein